jgi:hypothetical protein
VPLKSAHSALLHSGSISALQELYYGMKPVSCSDRHLCAKQRALEATGSCLFVSRTLQRSERSAGAGAALRVCGVSKKHAFGLNLD